MTREFIEAFLTILGICSILLLLHLFFNSYDEISEQKPAIKVVVLFFLFRLPREIMELMPMISLLSVLFSLGIMSKNNEVLAMHACGISYTRLGLPVALCGVALSIGVFFATEKALPYCEREATRYENIIKGSKPDKPKKDVFKPEPSDWIYYTEYYDSARNVMAFPVMFKLSPDGSHPVRKITAEVARMGRSPKDKDYDEWKFEKAVEWKYDQRSGESRKPPSTHESMIIRMPKDLDKLLGWRKTGQMNAWELSDLIGILQGFSVNTRMYSTELHHKIAFPFASLLLLMIGYTISVRAHVRSMVVGFAYGLASGVAYYVIDSVCLSFGKEGLIAPWIGGWLPNILFLGFVLFRLHYVNLVRD